ncbi:hypothetical protein H0I29_10315 [Polaribacter sp. R2A056_3_33]|uniref:hypothetical protein n=1 Tax=Polaribacter sp. R2A056_3_33 TaxID=2745563 RepID=UPI001C4FE964|nr:hypothetical protein [Polaribacter sp. R2A056_3_33]QXP69037.1 hypothetical protein H0I29_10315 [Polaribacter sp. R2A056_3_33]
MKEENIKNLITKYKLGTSSLKEEALLFDNVDDSETAIKAVATFVKKNKKVAPDNFNNDLWKSFDKKTTQKNRFKIGLISAAASILLISTLYINNISDNGLSYGEKEALLNEAKNMFTEQEVQPISVLIESDLIIVYTKIE